MTNDRTVHASGESGELVRYDRAGKWYFEPKVGKRTLLTLSEAVDKARFLWFSDEGTVHFDRPGGGALDSKIRRAKKVAP
jgi:hypothetical protein